MSPPGKRRERSGSALRRVSVALMVLCAAAGCETAETAGPEAASGAPGTPSPTDRPGAIAPAAPGAEATPTSPAPPPEIAALPVEPPPPPEPPPEPEVDSDPERLIGMAPEAVTDLLGPPAFVRNDAPSQLWRYRAPHCLLDLFLYESAGAARPRDTRVLYYTVQGNGEPVPTAEKCLRTLLLARMSKSTG